MALKKKNISVNLPLIDSKLDVLSYDVNSLNDKLMKIDMTRKMMGKSMEATFKIHIKDNEATAVPLKLVLFPFYLRRLIRKSSSYIEDSFLADSKDKKLRVKTFLITRKMVPRSIRAKIRKTCQEYILDYCKDKNYEEFFKSVLANSIQKEMSIKLKKIYPLAVCEIKEARVEKK
jgi:ribosomal protein S3AE